MSTEDSPLLGNQLESNAEPAQRVLSTEHVFERFDTGQKRAILVIVSLSGLIPTFVGGGFIPSVPQISKDLHSTPAAVSLAMSLSVLASSLGAMFWSAYTSFYGRRVMYICGMPLTILASFVVATSANLYSLLFWRFVQTFGCSGGNALGVATIGDIYRLEERGAAMGVFLGATLLGPAFAAPIGGFVTQYWSWRGFQVAMGVWCLIQLLFIIIFFPETAHPGTRGIDKVQGQRKLFVWVNPFRCVALLRSPNIMAIALANDLAYISDYTLSLPIAYTIGAKYGITSEGVIGLLFLPNSVGYFVGAPIAGRISDRAVQQAKEKRHGIWIPEDRLRVVWLGALVLIPISLVLAGLTTTYVDGTVGLVICLVCLFCNGVGVDMILTPTGAYAVDIMPLRSAEVMASISAFRALLLAPVSALCIPSVQTIGVAATNSVSAILSLFGYALIWLTIRYGKQMRAYVDVGYPDLVNRSLRV